MKNLEFEPGAFDDLLWWARQDHKKVTQILQLVDALRRDPFRGIGKPEPLKHNLAGYWSRRIDQEHRLVYKVTNEKIVIHSCRLHYK